MPCDHLLSLPGAASGCLPAARSAAPPICLSAPAALVRALLSNCPHLQLHVSLPPNKLIDAQINSSSGANARRRQASAENPRYRPVLLGRGIPFCPLLPSPAPIAAQGACQCTCTLWSSRIPTWGMSVQAHGIRAAGYVSLSPALTAIPRCLARIPRPTHDQAPQPVRGATHAAHHPGPARPRACRPPPPPHPPPGEAGGGRNRGLARCVRGWGAPAGHAMARGRARRCSLAALPAHVPCMPASAPRLRPLPGGGGGFGVGWRA